MMEDDHWKHVCYNNQLVMLLTVQIDLIIFVTFLHRETVAYKETLPLYFPKHIRPDPIIAEQTPCTESELPAQLELPTLALYYLTLSACHL